MKIVVPVFALALLAISGCATSYRSYSSVTGGITETKLGPDLVRIVFHGNSSTSKERAQDFALLRAADLAIEAGFPYFTLQNEEANVLRDSSSGVAIAMPTAEILVQFTRERLTGVITYDAAFLAHSLREKYEVK
jgi:hypothetical protein